MSERFSDLTHYEQVDYIRRAKKVEFFADNWNDIVLVMEKELERDDLYQNIPTYLLKKIVNHSKEHVQWFAAMELTKRPGEKVQFAVAM